jgi:hypothetical protein
MYREISNGHVCRFIDSSRQSGNQNATCECAITSDEASCETSAGCFNSVILLEGLLTRRDGLKMFL